MSNEKFVKIVRYLFLSLKKLIILKCGASHGAGLRIFKAEEIKEFLVLNTRFNLSNIIGFKDIILSMYIEGITKKIRQPLYRH